jgi:chemotaxis protein MotD
MTDAVKLAGNAMPAVQGGNGRSRQKSDQGGFEVLFRVGTKAGKADATRAGDARQGVAGLDLLARLEAVMALKDLAPDTGETGFAESDPAESDRTADSESDERDPEEALAAPMAVAIAMVGMHRPGEAGKPAPAAKGNGNANGAAVTMPNAVARIATGRGDPTELKSAAAEVGQVTTGVPVQPGAQPEAKGADFITFVPAERAAAAAGAGSEAADSGIGDRRGASEAAPPKVTMVAQQGVGAPGLAPGGTASALVAGLSGDSGWQNSARSVAALQHQAAQIGNAALHTMKLQLHPAELGMVTANLRFAGDQLQVELQVENREAFDRLKGDSEAIVKSLRALGYEIDQVSVQQPQIANNTTARAETNFGSASGSGRDAQAFSSQGERSGGERLGGQGNGRGDRNGGGRDGSNAQASQDNTQRGIYI